MKKPTKKTAKRISAFAKKKKKLHKTFSAALKSTLQPKLPIVEMSQAEADVLNERQYQRRKHHHDSRYKSNQLVSFARAILDMHLDGTITPQVKKWRKDCRKQLVVAAALLIAELDMNDRFNIMKAWQ